MPRFVIDNEGRDTADLTDATAEAVPYAFECEAPNLYEALRAAQEHTRSEYEREWGEPPANTTVLAINGRHLDAVTSHDGLLTVVDRLEVPDCPEGDIETIINLPYKEDDAPLIVVPAL